MPEDPQVHHVELEDGGMGADSIFTVGEGPAGVEHVSIGRGGPDGRAAVADYVPGGPVTDRVDGTGPRKIQSELRTATLLVDRLNLDGAAWHAPELELAGARQERGVDCVARDDAGATLLIQVTTTERELWGQLGRDPQAVRQAELDQVVAAVRAAIEHKVTRAAGNIVLALDATDSPRAALVADAFRKQHGEWAAGVGFASIWLVGPVTAVVQRLT